MGKYILSKFPALKRVSVTRRPMQRWSLHYLLDRTELERDHSGQDRKADAASVEQNREYVRGLAAVPTRPDGNQGQWYLFLYKA